MSILFVGLGGFVGAICRFIVSKKLNNKADFPVGTLTVNLLGAFLLGFLVGFQLPRELFAIAGTGFMGAFTTFSTFKVESVKLYNRRRQYLFYSYLFATYAGGIMFAFLGLAFGRSL